MNVELAIAAASCFVLALGHAAVGARWVLPNLTKDRLPSTPFGPPAMTLGMLRFTWHMMTLVLLGFSGLFMTLASATDAGAKTVLLRWFAPLWLAATATACWHARRRLRNLLRLPVPLLTLLIAVMCWMAST
jgi:hypothetical protein